MNGSPVIRAIEERLREVGYINLAMPIKIAGVNFSFTSAMRGRNGRSLDLILLIDTTTGDYGDRNGDRVQQRVQALSRALDITGSRYVVTVIVAGAALAEGLDALSETCRVLQVENVFLDEAGKLTDEEAKRQLDDRILLLLPLNLPPPSVECDNDGGPAMDQLIRAIPTNVDAELVAIATTASGDGEQAVTDAVARKINSAFTDWQSGDN